MNTQKKSGIEVKNDQLLWLEQVVLSDGYTPSKDEEYMSDQQLKYFYEKLITWKALLISESDQTLDELRNKDMRESDDNDRASSETETGVELRTRERYFKLINKIDHAITKIVNKTYGYCEDTGEEIGIGRLDARPIATLTIQAQEEHERRKKLTKQNASEENF